MRSTRSRGARRGVSIFVPAPRFSIRAVREPPLHRVYSGKSPGTSPGLLACLMVLIFFETEPEEVEGAVGAAFADGVSGAGPGGEVQHLRKRALCIGDTDEDEADGLLLRSA